MRTFPRGTTTSRRGRRGNAMVEFALSFGILFAAFTGVYQFGYAYYTYNNLETAIRAAGRYAAERTYDSASSTPSTAYTDAVRNMVLTGDPTTPPRGVNQQEGKYAIVRVNPDNIRVRMTFVDNVPAEVTVDVVNYPMDAFFKSFTLNGKPAVTFPFIGRWDPVN